MTDRAREILSPRTGLSGAHRLSSNPRLHSLAKPYSRPTSLQATPSAEFGALNGDFTGSPSHNRTSRSPVKQSAQTTRPSIPKSASARSFSSLTRSGSDTSLFSGLKSLISRPFNWISTPSRARKDKDDDAEWGAGPATAPNTTAGTARKRGEGREESSSPTMQHARAKRSRRRSPTPEGDHGMDGRSDYEPEVDRFSVTGRAVTGRMLPPLRPEVSLSRGIGSSRSRALPPNFSRPLPSSQSEGYLDMPQSMLSPARNTRSSMLRSSSRNNLASFADELDAEPVEEDETKWSPWKDRYSGNTRSSITPARNVPTRDTGVSEFGASAGSPFRAPYSPSANRNASGTRGLIRSATTSRMPREDSVASDASMGQDSFRGGSLIPSRTMLFGGTRDDDMSLDDDRSHREDSAMDWYMNESGRVLGSPSARAAISRLSATPSGSMPPIRRGQLVWDGKGGFIRDDELRRESAHDVHQNEAERILHSLQSSRRAAPLEQARVPHDTSVAVPIPLELIGASSRALRKAISVPLATSQSGESARQRRERERLGDNHNIMISPYGRTKVAHREEQKRRQERSASVMDEDFTPTPQAQPKLSSLTPQPAEGSEQSLSPAPTPRRSARRSARNKRKEDSAEVEDSTPKPRRRGKGHKADDDRHSTPPRRSTRRATSEKADSPPPPKASVAPPVPTITETAPSPTGPAKTSTYQVRDDNEARRDKSSLRVKSAHTSRNHTSAASRGVSPSSGRFSAREEDLPDMDELESNKIKLPSFSGITFGAMPVAAPKPDATASTGLGVAPPSSPLKLQRPPQGPLSRARTMERRKSPLATQPSIVAEPDTPPRTTQPAPKADATGFVSLSTSNSGTSTPAPAFTASSLFGAVGEKKAAGASLGIGKPTGPATSAEDIRPGDGNPPPSFFPKKDVAPVSTTPAHPPPAKTFSFGNFAPTPPPAPPVLSVAHKKDGALPSGGSVFGGTAVNIAEIESRSASATPAGADPTPAASPAIAPSPSPAFPSNVPAKHDDVQEKKNAFPTYKIGNNVTNTEPSFSLGTPAPFATATNGNKLFEIPRSTSAFGGPAPSNPASTTGKPAEAPQSAPSFAQSNTPASDASKPLEPAKYVFSLGQTAPATNTATSASSPPAPQSAKPPVSFGTSGAPAPASENTVKPSTFGAFGQGSSTPAINSAFGSSTSTNKPAENPNPFNAFGSKAPKPAEPATSAPSIGQNSTSAFGSTATSASTGVGSSQPGSAGFNTGMNPFGAPAPAVGGFGSQTPSAPGTPAVSASPFGGGGDFINGPTQANGSNPMSAFGLSAPSGDATMSNPTFGAPANGGGSQFGSSNSTLANATSGAPNNSFGGFAQNTPPASAGNAFGAPASNGFGGPHPAPAQPPQSSSNSIFAMNNNNNNNNNDTTGTASGGLNSFPPNNNAPVNAAKPQFQFGDTTPSLSKPFKFEAPAAGGTTTPNLFNPPPGQPAFQSFGSPGPGGASLFHMGAPPPASPSGRPIKPLRRRK